MAENRNEVLHRLMEHTVALERDMADLHRQARGWTQGSHAVATMHQVEKDFRMFEARLKGLISEIEHMEAKNRHFTGATVDRLSRPAAPPPSQPVRQPPPPTPPADPPPSTEKQSRLSSMATDLPESVREELRKAGLE